VKERQRKKNAAKMYFAESLLRKGGQPTGH